MIFSTNTLNHKRAAQITFEESVGKDPSLQFDVAFPHTYCRICGTVFQTPNDRKRFVTNKESHENMLRRKNWSRNHAKKHSDHEHMSLAISGLWVTPDAAYKLEGYGIHAVGSATLNENVRDALAEAPSTPQNDAEGS